MNCALYYFFRNVKFMTLKKLKKQRKENNEINNNSFSLYNNHSVH